MSCVGLNFGNRPFFLSYEKRLKIPLQDSFRNFKTTFGNFPNRVVRPYRGHPQKGASVPLLTPLIACMGFKISSREKWKSARPGDMEWSTGALICCPLKGQHLAPPQAAKTDPSLTEPPARPQTHDAIVRKCAFENPMDFLHDCWWSFWRSPGNFSATFDYFLGKKIPFFGISVPHKTCQWQSAGTRACIHTLVRETPDTPFKTPSKGAPIGEGILSIGMNQKDNKAKKN